MSWWDTDMSHSLWCWPSVFSLKEFDLINSQWSFQTSAVSWGWSIQQICNIWHASSVAVGMAMSAGWLHHIGPDWNSSTTIRWIAVTFGQNNCLFMWPRRSTLQTLFVISLMGVSKQEYHCSGWWLPVEKQSNLGFKTHTNTQSRHALKQAFLYGCCCCEQLQHLI